MQPDVGDVHVNALLSQLSVAYVNEDDAYIADRAFPLVYVDKQSDLYLKYDRGNFFADLGDEMLRAPGTNAATTGYKTTTDTYFAKNYAIGQEIPDELRGNADPSFDLDRDATMLVTQLQNIRRERAWAARYMTTSLWTGSSTGSDITVSNKWSDYGASDPMSDIRLELRSMQKKIGRRPNKVVMGQIVWDRIVDHPDFVDRIKGGATAAAPAIVLRNLLAQMWEVDEILVAGAVYNTAQENLTVSTDFIIDDDLLLLYTPRNPGRLVPAAGYTMVWRTLVNGSDAPQFIRRIREDRPRKDIVEAFAYWDQVQVDPLAGVFFPDIVD